MNINKSLTYFTALFLVLSVGFSSCKDDEGGGTTATQSIYGVLAADASYSVIVKAIDRVGLKAQLDGSTEYTFLAPSDEDFELQQIDPEAMTDAEVESLVKYHLFVGKIASSEFKDDSYYSTEASASTGAKLSVYVLNAGSPKFNGYTAAASVSATNGVVHKMSGVLEPLTIREMLRENEAMSTFSAAVALDAGIKTQLEGNDNTIFATKEEAFIAYLNSENAVLSTLQPSKRRTITNNAIIVDKALRSSEVAGTHTTLESEMTVTNSGGTITVNGKAEVLVSDIICTNGVIYLIDELLN